MSETSPQHIPVVQKLKNVWITDAEADRITIFCDGEKETFFLEAETEGSDSVPAPEQMREQLADVELTDELVSAVVLKTDKFTGRVLSANENGIEIEGRGRIPLAEDYKGYRLYRELTMCTFADLTFGYANADFIQENGVRGKKNKESSIYKIGKFTFDTQKQILSTPEKQTKLTTKESELLGLLCAHANEILQRDFALKTIWIDDNYFNARSMDVYITKLRKHLKEDESIEIINIHGKGYKLITPEAES